MYAARYFGRRHYGARYWGSPPEPNRPQADPWWAEWARGDVAAPERSEWTPAGASPALAHWSALVAARLESDWARK